MNDFENPQWRFRGDSNKHTYSGALPDPNLTAVPAFTESMIALMDEESLPAMNRQTTFTPDGTMLWQDANGAVLARVQPTAQGLYRLPADDSAALERAA
ncbi:hypothetical protein [Tessaracoccus sp.]